MKVALHNGRVLTVDGFRNDLVVLIDEAQIVALASLDDPRIAQAHLHDLDGGILLPGFIDCQVNGGGDILFNDAPSVESIRRIGAAHRRFGTTGFLPTLISDDRSVMRSALAAVDAAIEQGVPGVLGIHLEGPYLSAQRKGVHNPEKFHKPDSSDMQLVTSCERGVTLLTLAPECVSIEALRQLAARGIVLAAGHTAADYAQTRAALGAGVRGFTHLFNAMTPFGSREPGVVGAALEDRDSWCGVIVDGQHVHPASLRVALAAKPRGKVFLVTDAMPPVGGERADFVLNGERILCHDGQCRTASGTLAGSALDMLSALRNTIDLGVPLDEAARMAATYPAQFLGLGTTHGRIAAGYRADLVLLDARLELRHSWIGGEGSRHGLNADRGAAND